MGDYNSVFEMAKNLGKYSKEKKYDFDLIDLSEQIREGNLSVFSKVIDFAIEERYSEFKRLGYINELTQNSYADELQVLQSDINILNSAFFTKISELELKGYPPQMLQDRVDEHSEMISICESLHRKGISKAKSEVQNIVEDIQE